MLSLFGTEGSDLSCFVKVCLNSSFNVGRKCAKCHEGSFLHTKSISSPRWKKIMTLSINLRILLVLPGPKYVGSQDQPNFFESLQCCRSSHHLHNARQWTWTDQTNNRIFGCPWCGGQRPNSSYNLCSLASHVPEPGYQSHVFQRNCDGHVTLVLGKRRSYDGRQVQNLYQV